MDKGSAIQLSEKKRTYFFPNNEIVTLENVTELIVRESGTHRLKTTGEKLHIIPAGWVHIEIDAREWDV